MRIEELVGQNVRDLRVDLDMRQEELGRRLGELLGRDWPRQTVSAAEKGARSFVAEELVALALVLGQPVERLFRIPVGVDHVELSSGREVDRRQMHGLAAVVDREAAEAFEAIRSSVDSLVAGHRERSEHLEVENLLLQSLDGEVRNLEAAWEHRDAAPVERS